MIRIYESPEFIKFVLKNEKMDKSTKLILIKFMEQIRMSAQIPANHTQWKKKI